MELWRIIFLIIVEFSASTTGRRPKVVKDDCILYGIRHGVTWTDPLFPCIQKKCIDGRVIDKMTGCLYKGKCYRPGERWKEGCSHRSCVYFEDFHMGRKYQFYAVDGTAWCDSQEGDCRAPGEEWTHNCCKYQCIEEDHVRYKEARIQKIEKLPNCTCCKYNGRCYPDGSVWSDDNCIDRHCDLVNVEGQIMETITSVPGCRYEGNCYKFSDTLASNCFIYECSTTDGVNVQWNPIKKACAVGNRCVNINETLRNETSCMEYYCDNSARTIYRQYGCMYKDRCIPYGEYFYDDLCYYRLCSLKQDMVVLEVKSGGCSGLDGECYSYGEQGFSRSIPGGDVVVNCSCQQRGNTGSLTSCNGKSYGNIPQIVIYHLDDSVNGEEVYRLRDQDTIINNISGSEEDQFVNGEKLSISDPYKKADVNTISNMNANQYDYENVKTNNVDNNNVNSDTYVPISEKEDIESHDNLVQDKDDEINTNLKNILGQNNEMITAGTSKQAVNIVGINTEQISIPVYKNEQLNSGQNSK